MTTTTTTTTDCNYDDEIPLLLSNSNLLQWPIKQYIPVTPHIWLIWSSGTLHPEIYGLPLPTFSLELVVTSQLVLEVVARHLLLFGIVCPLTSVLAKLSQHSADTWSLIFFIQAICNCLATHLSASDLLTTTTLYKSIYCVTYLLILTYQACGHENYGR